MIMTEEEKLLVSILIYLSESPGNPKEEAQLVECALTLVEIKNSSQQYQSEEEEDDEEEEEEKEDEEEEEEEEVLPKKKREAKKEKLAEQASTQKLNKKKEIEEVDDSEETLAILREWNRTRPEKPPREMVDPEVVGVCSKLMRKQLMGSDVKGNQCRLMLVKKEVKEMMDCVFGETEKVGTDGIKVSVYGKDGEVYEMMFKMWNKNTVPVLTSTVWNKFVADYGLMKHCDFLNIWMFRHKESGKICFAVDSSTRFDSITKRLSKRISKIVLD